MQETPIHLFPQFLTPVWLIEILTDSIVEQCRIVFCNVMVFAGENAQVGPGDIPVDKQGMCFANSSSLLS